MWVGACLKSDAAVFVFAEQPAVPLVVGLGLVPAGHPTGAKRADDGAKPHGGKQCDEEVVH